MSDQIVSEVVAARIIGMSRAWLQRKRWEGGGPPFIKYDRAVRYRMKDLEEWVEAHVKHAERSSDAPQL